MQDQDRDALELAQETVRFETRRVVTGRVRVRTETETYEHLATGELVGETVEVERVTMNVYVDEAPPVRSVGDLTIVPVVEEVLVVEKRLLLTEEIRIRRTPTTETVEAPVTLRRQRAIVERIDPETGDGLNDLNSTSED